MMAWKVSVPFLPLKVAVLAEDWVTTQSPGYWMEYPYPGSAKRFGAMSVFAPAPGDGRLARSRFRGIASACGRSGDDAG